MGQILTTQDAGLPNFRGLQQALEAPIFSFPSFRAHDAVIVDRSLGEPGLWKKMLEYFFQPETQDDWKERQSIMRLTIENGVQRQELNFDEYYFARINEDFQLVKISEKEAVMIEARAMAQRHMRNNPQDWNWVNLIFTSWRHHHYAHDYNDWHERNIGKRSLISLYHQLAATVQDEDTWVLGSSLGIDKATDLDSVRYQRFESPSVSPVHRYTSPCLTHSSDEDDDLPELSRAKIMEIMKPKPALESLTPPSRKIVRQRQEGLELSSCHSTNHQDKDTSLLICSGQESSCSRNDDAIDGPSSKFAATRESIAIHHDSPNHMPSLDNRSERKRVRSGFTAPSLRRSKRLRTKNQTSEGDC